MAGTVRVELTSASPYSQSRYYTNEVPFLSKEGKDEYEIRTWRNKMHVDVNGEVVIPEFAIKNCLSEVAKRLGMQIKGKGKSTYTKHFVSGIMVTKPVATGVQATSVKSLALHVPSDGVRGSGKRVIKYFPVLQEWSGTAEIHVLDDIITPPVFEEHIREAGKFIGLGTFRPANNGHFGRFRVGKIEWSDLNLTM